jgi:peptidoglycan hydrolase CwlO-like protein
LSLTAVVCALIVVAPARAHSTPLQQNRARARELAGQISALDARIGSAVTRYSRATQSLEAVRREVKDSRRLQRLASHELGVARATLATRAVAMYKQSDVTPMDAVFGAADLGDLVTQLSMVRTIARCDRDVVRTIETTQREQADRAKSLAADERTAVKLVGTCKSELAAIRARLEERRATLSGVRSDIRRLAAETTSASPAPTPTVELPQTGDDPGSGSWWALIRSAAASNGVSARGMYRLMMVESGGSAAVVGPGGYYGLFQYAPTTWKGDWNPWRSSDITDGSAQIKATALALRLGYGHAWWDPSYTWAFQGD